MPYTKRDQTAWKDVSRHAPDPIFLTYPQGNPGRGTDRLAPADAACGHDPASLGRHLFLAAAGLQGPAAAGRYRPRGTAARGPHPDADADLAIGRSVARERPLRRLRAGDAAHQGPARARPALRPDQRRADHRHLPLHRDIVPRAAADALSHPVEIPRRDPPAIRRDAGPRVLHEGRLQFRPDQGRRAARLQPALRQLPAHLRADGAEGDPDACRYRADRR